MPDTIEPVQVGNLWLDPRTIQPVADALNSAYSSQSRIRVWYGDTLTGKAWQEEHDVLGYVGRSTGKWKVPLLIANARSMGAPAMLDHCIVRVDRIEDRRTLYRHAAFHTGLFQARVIPADIPDYAEAVALEGSILARFRKAGGGQRWLDFMNGNRYSK